MANWRISRAPTPSTPWQKPISKNIENRYLELGGEIAYKSKVKKVLVENNQAVGVLLENGSQHVAELVVSAADGYSTIFKMLDGKYVDDTLKGWSIVFQDSKTTLKQSMLLRLFR